MTIVGSSKDPLPDGPDPLGDLEERFNPRHVHINLPLRSITSAGATILCQGTGVILQVASTVVLARLITPEEYGIFGIVMACTAFGTGMKDLGLPMAALQSYRFSPQQASTLFWIGLAYSLLLAALTMSCAPLVATIYMKPSIAPLMITMSLTYVISAASSQHQVLLRRQMSFIKLGIIEVFSLGIGVSVGILTALWGAKFWALVYMQLSMTACNTIGTWLASRWCPGRPDSLSAVVPLLQFGRQITVLNVINYFARNLDNLLIGRVCGVGPLGIYDKAYQLHMLPTQYITWPLTSVAQSSLSRTRTDPIRFRRFAETTMFATTSVCVPIIGFLFVKAPEIVTVMLGARWLSTAGTFRALAAAAVVDIVHAVLGWALVAHGQPARLVRYRLGQAIVTLVGFVIGLNWGAIGVAVSLSLTRVILFPAIFYFCCEDAELEWRRIALAAAAPLIATCVAALAVHCAGDGNWSKQWTGIVFGAALFTIVYASVWSCFPDSRNAATTLIYLVSKGKNDAT